MLRFPASWAGGFGLGAKPSHRHHPAQGVDLESRSTLPAVGRARPIRSLRPRLEFRVFRRYHKFASDELFRDGLRFPTARRGSLRRRGLQKQPPTGKPDLGMEWDELADENRLV